MVLLLKGGVSMKIKNQLLLTHGLLVIFSLLIVLINVVSYNGMDSDASIINQSGKLRALSYNMAQLSNQIIESNDGSDAIAFHMLESRMEEFDSILIILRDKENNSNAGIKHNETIERLEKTIVRWEKEFKPTYQSIVKNESIDKTEKKINNEIEEYVNEIDEMVTLYSIYAREKVFRALGINGALVFLLIIVTIYSFKSTNSRIQKPMKDLIEEIKELSFYDDTFTKKLNNIRTNEISEMSKYFSEMMYDQLTNVLNRRSGLAKFIGIMQNKKRRQLIMSICFIDINGLKIVNDELGHKFGDELIVTVTDCIKKEIREEDFIIRMGGDEFLVLFKDINEENSEKIWERINNRYQQINKKEDRKYIISVSHGIIEYNSSEKREVEWLIKKADEKMYKEKRYIKEELNIKIIK